MNTLFKVSLAGIVVAAIAGCANIGTPDGENNGATTSRPELAYITEKIDLQIPFDKSELELTAGHKTELSEFLTNLRTETKDRSVLTFSAIVVTVHTDRIGPLSYNMKISGHLADLVKDYMVNAGNVDPALIFSEGRGPQQPLSVTVFCDDQTTLKQRIECLAPNRRVTVEVAGTALIRQAAKPAANIAVRRLGSPAVN